MAIESFESSFGDWSQVAGDDFDWDRHEGSTGSGGTGPSSAYDGTWYVYTESSGSNYPSKVAILENDSFNGGKISFYYHMYGSGMGTLKLEEYVDGEWSELWSKTGNQGDEWHASGELTIDSNATKLRFHMTTGSSYTSDASLDYIDISGPVTYTQTCTAKANIKATNSQSVRAKAYFEPVFGKWSETGQFDITETKTVTVTAKANIEAGGEETRTKTITAKGNIQKNKAQTVTAKGRIQHTRTKTIESKARIQKEKTITVNAKGRIEITTSRSITAKGVIKTSQTKTLTGKGNIKKTFNQTLIVKSRIQKSFTQLLTVKSRIEKSFNQTIESKSSIKKLFTQNITVKGSIQKSNDKTITAKARIQINPSKTISSLARIEKESTQTLTVKANIKATVTEGYVYNPNNKKRNMMRWLCHSVPCTELDSVLTRNQV